MTAHPPERAGDTIDWPRIGELLDRYAEAVRAYDRELALQGETAKAHVALQDARFDLVERLSTPPVVSPPRDDASSRHEFVPESHNDEWCYRCGGRKSAPWHRERTKADDEMCVSPPREACGQTWMSDYGPLPCDRGAAHDGPHRCYGSQGPILWSPLGDPMRFDVERHPNIGIGEPFETAPREAEGVSGAVRDYEPAIREILWLRHGCSFGALYGDDGEMQCSACGIDFKRSPADVISQRFRDMGLAALRARPEATRDDATDASIDHRLRHARADIETMFRPAPASEGATPTDAGTS